MTVDVEGLRSTIRSIRQKIVKQQIVGLHLMERLNIVLDRLDDALAQGSAMILITSDYRQVIRRR